VVAISTMVEKWHLDPVTRRTARVVAHGSWSQGPPSFDGGHRYAPRTWGFERRCDLSQPGRPLRSDQRRQTHRLRRRYGPATLRASRPRLRVPASTSEASAVEQILDDLARSGADERLELVLVDRGTARSAATGLSNKFNYEVRRVGWDEPPRNEHGAKVFRPIRHAWRVEVAHGHLVRRRRLARCFENTVTSATGWLHVASIAEVLRALC